MYASYKSAGLHKFRKDAAQKGQETGRSQQAVPRKPAYGV